MRRAPPVAAGSTGDGSMGLTTTAISSHQDVTRTKSPSTGAPNVAPTTRDDRAAMGHLSRPAYVPPGAIGSDLRHISQKLGPTAGTVCPLRPPLALAPAPSKPYAGRHHGGLR